MKKWDRFFAERINGDDTRTYLWVWEIESCSGTQTMRICYIKDSDENEDPRLYHAKSYTINWTNACTHKENVVQKIKESVEKYGQFTLYPNKEGIPYIFTAVS